MYYGAVAARLSPLREPNLCISIISPPLSGSEKMATPHKRHGEENDLVGCVHA